MAELSAVELEVVRHALAGVADEMGIALRRAAYSPNIKERADCSAAVGVSMLRGDFHTIDTAHPTSLALTCNICR